MITLRGFEGKRMAVFGLARTGLAAARALAQTKRLALDAATLAAERKDLMQ